MSEDPRYELDLACGDTISSNVQPKPGAHRQCIHCEAPRRVIAIRDTHTGRDLTSALSVAEVTRQRLASGALGEDITSGNAYAHDAGYFRGTLQHLRSQLAGVQDTVDALELPGISARLQWCADAIEQALNAAQVDYDATS